MAGETARPYTRCIGPRKQVRRCRVVRLACACVALCLALATYTTPVSARADGDGSGLWYITDTGVRAAHEAGIDGSGITIAEIDTPYNPSVPWLAEADITHSDAAMCLGPQGAAMPAVSEDYAEAYHATDMIGLIVGNGQGALSGQAPYGVAPAATVKSYTVLVTSGWTEETYGNKCVDEERPTHLAVALAINAALKDGADIISIPVDFPVPDAQGQSALGPYGQAISQALAQGVPVVVSRTNDNEGPGLIDAFGTHDAEDNAVAPEEWKTALTTTRSEYFPGLLTLNAIDQAGIVQVESNERNTGVDLVAPGVGVTNEQGGWGLFQTDTSGGSSAAVAITAGYLALAMQKWPEATGNQILQALVASSSGKGERNPDTGWGAINLPAFLATNPSQFPDVNPILALDVQREWATAENWGWHTPDHPFYTDYTSESSAQQFGLILARQSLAASQPFPPELIGLIYQPLTKIASAVAAVL